MGESTTEAGKQTRALQRDLVWEGNASVEMRKKEADGKRSRLGREVKKTKPRNKDYRFCPQAEVRSSEVSSVQTIAGGVSQ
jgi:hypothetical protein